MTSGAALRRPAGDGAVDRAAEASGTCFHCGLPVPPGGGGSLEVLGAERAFCCPGCRAVAQAIVAGGLEDYYRHRTRSAGPVGAVPEDLALYDTDPPGQDDADADAHADARETSLVLEGIVCAACVWLSERHVKALPGVLAFSVNYTTHRARVRWDPRRIRLSDILRAIADIGYRAHPHAPGRRQEAIRRERDQALRRLAVAGAGTMQVMMIAVGLWLGEGRPGQEAAMTFLRWAALIFATPVVLYAGAGFFVSAWRNLRHRQLGMDVPVALAVGATYGAGVWTTVSGDPGPVYFESACMFVFFLLLGHYLEMGARQRAGEACEALDASRGKRDVTECADIGSELFPFLVLSPNTGTLRTVHLDSLLLVAHLDGSRAEGTRPVGRSPANQKIVGHRARNDCLDDPAALPPLDRDRLVVV
ncbi:MAG: heavy metal translocating P-type ATPase metal-binding domain-containing protein, partial [Ectothiorhodospira sp.]